MNTTCCEKCQLSSAEPERGIYQAWCNNKNCPCHKSAEKLTAVNNSSDGQIHIPTVFGEAPTDENAEHVAMNIVHQIGDVLYEALPPDVAHELFVKARQATNDVAIDFAQKLIVSLLQKEREKLESYLAIKHSFYEAGKSEAFSLVRKMMRGATDLRDPKTQIYKIINAHDFLTKLSTLEGK